MSRFLVISALISTACLAVHSVIAYENAYDLLERRNQKFYEPQFQPGFYADRRFFTPNQTPYLRESNSNRYFSEFGNGYDNLGNGMPGHFRPFRQQGSRSWRFERRPYRQRILKDFDFGYHTLRRPHQEYIHYLPGMYNPSNIPGGLYENDFSLRKKTDAAKFGRFFEENEDNRQKKSDDYFHRNQEGAKLDSFNKEKIGEHIHADQVGKNKSSLRSNKVVKKGRTTTGFAVHHHKDETGNSTRFFDETSDFGGQSDLKDIADGFDARKTLEEITQKGDEKYFAETQEKSGNYGSGQLKGNQKFEKEFSSLDNHEESEREFDGNGSDDLGLRKTYQYLNGDAFDYSNPHVANY